LLFLLLLVLFIVFILIAWRTKNDKKNSLAVSQVSSQTDRPTATPYLKNPDNMKIVSSPVAMVGPSVQASPADSATPDWYIYKNSVYKFEVTFNDAWQNCLVEKKLDYGGLAEGAYEVKLPVVIPDIPLSFYIYKTDKWNEEINQESSPESPLKPAEITRNANYVYAYQMWSSTPPTPGAIRDKDITEALKTFKLL